jgi:hypothetical protein
MNLFLSEINHKIKHTTAKKRERDENDKNPQLIIPKPLGKQKGESRFLSARKKSPKSGIAYLPNGTRLMNPNPNSHFLALYESNCTQTSSWIDLVRGKSAAA